MQENILISEVRIAILRFLVKYDFEQVILKESFWKNFLFG